MSDGRLRELERRWNASGTLEDQQRLWAARWRHEGKPAVFGWEETILEGEMHEPGPIRPLKNAERYIPPPSFFGEKEMRWQLTVHGSVGHVRAWYRSDGDTTDGRTTKNIALTNDFELTLTFKLTGDSGVTFRLDGAAASGRRLKWAACLVSLPTAEVQAQPSS